MNSKKHSSFVRLRKAESIKHFIEIYKVEVAKGNLSANRKKVIQQHLLKLQCLFKMV